LELIEAIVSFKVVCSTIMWLWFNNSHTHV